MDVWLPGLGPWPQGGHQAEQAQTLVWKGKDHCVTEWQSAPGWAKGSWTEVDTARATEQRGKAGLVGPQEDPSGLLLLCGLAGGHRSG